MFYESKHPLNADYYQIEHGKNFSFPPHIHHCFEIITVTEGEMLVTVGGKSRKLSKNSAALVFPNQIHSLKTDNNSAHTLCIFSGKLVNSFSKQTSGLTPTDNFFELPSFMVSLLNGLTDKSSQSTVKGVLYLLCGTFDEKALYEEHGATKSEQLLTKIFEYVSSNYRDSCNLKQLSEYLRYDYAYVSRVFRLGTGITFNAFLNQYRISEACYLLRTSDETVIQIAEECGYDSLRSFNRNFKEYTGVSPAQYRKSGI